MDDEGGFEYRQIVGNGRPADLTGSGKTGRLKYASALSEQEFSKTLKGMPSFKPEEFLNILGPVGIHPFLEISFGSLLSKEELRHSASQETMSEIRSAEILEIC